MKIVISHKALVIILAITISVAFNNASCQNDGPTLYEQMSRSIVRLEHIEIVSRSGQAIPDTIEKTDGTAFIVKYGGTRFLVAARHVAEQKYDLKARVDFKNLATDQYEIKELIIEKRAWVFHPDSGNDSIRYVDIAVAKMPPLTTGYGNTVIQESLFADGVPDPPTDIVVFGFPGKLGFDLSKQMPMARSGIIAMISNERFIRLRGQFLHENLFLVDAPIFPGNSGSPVFAVDLSGNAIDLIGIVILTDLELDYGVCEPISKLRETLEYALKK